MSRSPTRGLEITVQGAGTSAPAVERGDQTGSHTTPAITSNRSDVEVASLAPAATITTSQRKFSDLISVPTQKTASKSPPCSPIRPFDMSAYQNEGLRSILDMMSARINLVVSAFETHRHVTRDTKGAIAELATLNARAIQIQEQYMTKKGAPSKSAATQTEVQMKEGRAVAATKKTAPVKPPVLKPPVLKPPHNKDSVLSASYAREAIPPSFASVAKEGNNKVEWTKVTPKRLRKKPEAIIIKKTGDASYADMLRKLKADPSLNDFGNHVKKIRRTQQGELLLEVEGKASASMPTYRGAIEESLREMAAVRTGAQRMAVICGGMDEATTTEELHSCLVSQFEGILVNPDDVRGLRKMRDGTQVATVMLSVNDAITVLKKGSVTVGWSRCRITQDTRPTRCFRCLGYGHRAIHCKATDHSDCCLRCGERGHKAKGCDRPPRCLICSDNVDRNHPTGGFKCPTYKGSVTKGAMSRHDDAGPN